MSSDDMGERILLACPDGQHQNPVCVSSELSRCTPTLTLTQEPDQFTMERLVI